MASLLGSGKIKYIKFRRRKTDYKPHDCYIERKENLSQVGYSSYKEFLKSDEWKAQRKRLLDKSPICFLCTKKAEHVHHTDYSCECLLGLHDLLLVTLCSSCHESIEFNGNYKRTLKGANIILVELASLTDIGRVWVKRWEKLLRKLERARENRKPIESIKAKNKRLKKEKKARERDKKREEQIKNDSSNKSPLSWKAGGSKGCHIPTLMHKPKSDIGPFEIHTKNLQDNKS